MQTLTSLPDSDEVRSGAFPRQRGSDEIRAVCHDLRGHLATIGMIASALRAEPVLPEAADRRLSALLDEVALTTEMVRRVVTGNREVCLVDLGSVARRCAQRLSRTALQLITCDADQVEVFADEVQLTRLLDNVLENAVRAAGPSGVVTVEVRRALDLRADGDTRAASALVTVEDSGPGFGHATPGLASLGLSIVSDVLDELGGTYELGRSNRLGGARVTMTIPVAGR